MRAQRGTTLLEVLFALALTLLIATAVGTLLDGVARMSLAEPVRVDEQQRVRSGVEAITGWLATAGQGLTGSGENAGALPIPALYPQRRGVVSVDPENSMFPDRVTVVKDADPPAVALLTSVARGTGPLVMDLTGCGPGRVSCGFGAGDRVLVADNRASGEWFSVVRADSATLVPQAALAGVYDSSAGAVVIAVDVRSLYFDASRRQIRLLSGGADSPAIDNVGAFDIRWFGEPRAPAGPIPPTGEDTCVMHSDAPRLGPLPATAGPWVELSAAILTDGPWCGASPWRFDADLFRVRMLEIAIVFEPVSPRATPIRVEMTVSPRNLQRAS